MAQINKTMIIHDIIMVDTDIIPILLDAGISEPSKYFFNAATPELIHKRVGSLCGTKDAPGSIIWPLSLKKFNQIFLISTDVNIFISISPFKQNKKYLKERKIRGTILVQKIALNFIVYNADLRSS